MQLILACSLFFCATAAVLTLFQGWVVTGVAVVLMAAIYFLLSISFPAVTGRAFAAALFALGIGALYSALYFFAVGHEHLLVSDAALYDALARDIAEAVPWHTQINPFSYAYVRDLGFPYGAINQPGYYKILGIGYTVALGLQIDSVSMQVPTLINLVSFSLTGLAFYKLLENCDISEKKRWMLWATFMTTLLNLLPYIRKDVFLLLLSVFAIHLIHKRYHPVLVISLVSFIATIRLPQAACLAVLFLIYEALVRGWRPAVTITRQRALTLTGTFALAFAGVQYGPELHVAPESLQALLEDLKKASFGFSQYLTRNIFGVALYGILYPFPSLLPRDIASILNTVYAYVHLILLGGVALMYLGKDRDASPFELALWITLSVVLAGYAFTAMMSWKYLGFVVFESRFKLLGLALIVILFGYGLRERQRKSYR